MTNTTKRPMTAVACEITGRVLTITFGNGNVLKVSADDLNADTQRDAMMHGLKQKLIDAAAISRDTETGRAASVEDKERAVRAVAERLLRGEWNAVARSGGGSGGLLHTALMRLYPNMTDVRVKAFLEGKTEAEKLALRSDPRIARLIDAIRAERVAGKASIDANALLAGLESEG